MLNEPTDLLDQPALPIPLQLFNYALPSLIHCAPPYPSLGHAGDHSHHLCNRWFFKPSRGGTYWVWLNREINMRSISRPFAWIVGTALIAVSLTTTGSAQYPEASTTIDQRRWTDEEIKKEFDRYKFTGLEFLKKENLPKPKLVILSGFSEIGKYWRHLDDPKRNYSPDAFVRRQELAAFYGSAASVRYSLLAKLIRVIRTERRGNWLCAVGLGCYPKGYVVGLGPVDSETAKLVCELQRRNHYFCGIYEP